MIHAVIFDMDGIIADTEILQSKAWEKILKEYDKKPIYESNGLIHVIGTAGDQSYKDLKTKYNLPSSIEELKQKKRGYFEKLIDEELLPLEGFMELVKILEKSRYKIAVASNRNIKHIHLILEKLAVKDYFDVIVGPGESRRHKPHPDIYLETAKQLGLKPEECLALEDTDLGIQSAISAGMKVIAIPNYYTKTHDFSEATKIVNSMQSVTIALINSI